MLAIIGGSGLTTLSNLDVRIARWSVPLYGEAWEPWFRQICGKPAAVFLPRHGYGHTHSPHWSQLPGQSVGLAPSSGDRVISVASVGGIRGDLHPGDTFRPTRSSITPGGGIRPSIEMARRCITSISPSPYDADFEPQNFLRSSKLIEGRCRLRCQIWHNRAWKRRPEVNCLERDGADVSVRPACQGSGSGA